MTAQDIKANMAVYHMDGKKIACGYSLYNFRLDHYERTHKAAAAWSERENIKLRDQIKARR